MADGGMCMLEHKLGQFDGGPGHLFYFSPSNPTGHYRLELRKTHDRDIMQRLVAINHEQLRYRQEHNLLDTSAHGDFDVSPLAIDGMSS
jgi:hypothetical protein